MTKGRAQIRKERIDSWFSDLIDEFNYFFTAEDLKAVRIHRIQMREGTTKTPSLMAIPSEKVARASSDLPVILITPFENRAEEIHSDATNQLYEWLLSVTQAEDLKVKIEKSDQSVDEESAKKIAKQFDASIIVWGWQDAASLHLHMDMLKNLSATIEKSQPSSLVPPKRITFKPLADIEASIPYLVKFLLGAVYFSNGDPQKAGLCFEEALESLPQTNSVSIGPDESLLFRVVWSYS